MKLLHTSDWHLGRTTRNVSRAPDHEQVLSEIIDIAQRARPDLILHTGDLFDVVRPGYESMQLGMQALQELASIAPVVVLCGNHDSPLLFRLFNQVLSGPDAMERLRSLPADLETRSKQMKATAFVPGLGRRLIFVDRARHPDEGGILQFDTANGDRVKLASVPFVHANRMIDAFEKDPTEWTAAYADRIRRLEDVLGRGLQEDYDVSRDVLVFAGHLHVGGARYSTSERAIHVSDAYATRVEHLPPVTYAAFGHIHRPQQLPGLAAIGRYAGSPIPLDFGELGEEKSVVLVEANPGDAPAITTIPLFSGRPLRRFDGTLQELAAIAPQIGEELCSFVIRTKVPAVDLADQVRDLVPRAVVLEVLESCAARSAEVLAQAKSTDESEPDFVDLLRRYLSETGTKGGDPEQLRGLFACLFEAAQTEQYPDLPVLRALSNPLEISIEKINAEHQASPSSYANQRGETAFSEASTGAANGDALSADAIASKAKRKPTAKRAAAGTQGSLLP